MVDIISYVINFIHSVWNIVREYVLKVLIGGNLTPYHDFMKLYTRKPPNFLEMSICVDTISSTVLRGVSHEGRLIGREVYNQEQEGNRDTRVR